MAVTRLEATFSAPDTAALVDALADALPDSPPDSCEADYEDADPADWLAAVRDAEESAAARWDGAAVIHSPGRFARLDVPLPGRDATVDLLSDLPFTVASLSSYAEVWESEHGYTPPSFADGHPPHGWACAFRGDGHQRLVSRRWLDHGPWELIRGGHDTSFVQFHPLSADAGRALDVARPGHERMGISDRGGYLQTHPARLELRGLRDGNTHKVVVHGREIPERELLDACQIRRVEELDAVAYVFMEREQAEAELPRLWLRELQCWTIVDGEEVRLDADEPPQGLGS